MIVADETEEFQKALSYAAKSAMAHAAKIAILLAMPEQEFLHWGKIEEQMKQDQRNVAEGFVLGVARRLQDINPNVMPMFFMRDGDPIEAMIEVLSNNPGICKVILGANSHGIGNPLLDYFTGKGLGKLTVPMTIVPDHISFEHIDYLLAESL